MRKAADPVTIERGFRALGVPLADDHTQQNIGPTTSQDEETAPIAGAPQDENDKRASSRWTLVCQDLATRVISPSLLPGQISLLAERWYDLAEPASTEGPSSDTPTDLLEIQTIGQQTLDSITAEFGDAEQDDSAEAEWGTLLTRFEDEWNAAFAIMRNESSAAPDSVSPAFRRALETRIDELLWLTLRDASPWTKQEHAGFWRMLMQTDLATATPSDSGASDLASTQWLESEGASQKGNLVRYRAEVRTMEYVAKPNSRLGIDGYWLMWVQGSDRAVQPVAVYSAQPLQPIADIMQDNQDAPSQVFPEIEVNAYIGKRLAYNAQDGVRVAPTLFAKSVAVRERAAPATATTNPEQITKDFRSALMIGLLAAAAVLLPILWSWNQRASRRPQSMLKHTKKLLWLFALMHLSQFMVAGPLWAQLEQPPWAIEDAATQQKRKALQLRFEKAGSKETTSQFQDFIENDPQTIPNDLLKVFRVLDQSNWRDSLDVLAGQQLNQGDITWTPVDMRGIATAAQMFTLTSDQDDWFRASTGTSLYRLEIEPIPAPSGNAAQAEVSGNFADDKESDDDLEPAKPATSLSVVCEFLPKRWLQNPALRQPVRIQGLIARQGDRDWLVIAKHTQWRLNQSEPDLGIQAQALASLLPPLATHERELGLAGWDLTWLDLARQNHAQPLGANEATGFYTLLDCLAADNTATRLNATPDLEAHQAILHARASAGKRIQWFVRLVSGSVVSVDDPKQRIDLGGESYYQFDGFVDIGNNRFNYRVGSEVLTFEREFPITIVTKQPNEFVDQAAIARGELSWDVGQYAQVDGRFYRMWSYQSELVDQTAAGFRQNAPLIVGTRFTPAVPRLASNSVSVTGWFGYALCGATVLFAGTLIALVLKREKPRRYKRRKQA